MPQLIDISGNKYGRWNVIGYAGNKKWLCKCDCGTEKLVEKTKLIRGESKSCGCYRQELVSASRTTHGMSKSKTGNRLYGIWSGVKDRCNNTKSKYYERYGAKGIFICPEWNNDYMSFHNWSIQNGYADNLTLDRIDNSKGYCPDNCRWVDYEIQENNRTNNILFKVGNETLTLAQLSRKCGLSRALTEKKYKENRIWEHN